MSERQFWLMVLVSFLLMATGVVAGIITNSEWLVLGGLLLSIAVLIAGKMVDR